MIYGIDGVMMMYRSVRLRLPCTQAQDVAWKQAIACFRQLVCGEVTSTMWHPLFVRQAAIYRKKTGQGKSQSGEQELRYWQGFHVDASQHRLRFFDQQGRWHTAFFTPDERQQTILTQGRAVSMALRLDEVGWSVNLLVFLTHLQD